MGQFCVVNGEVRVVKEVHEIDAFVLKTMSILSKYTDYVIVSGYVAIFFGRSRGSEDVDMFIKEMSKERFVAMYQEFVRNGFEFSIDAPEELYEEYLTKGLPVGVWEKDLPLLRLDMKLPKTRSQHMLFTDRIKVFFSTTFLWIASIESTIAYKEEIARSEKDLLDAKHLRVVFAGLDDQKIDKYKQLFMREFGE